MVVVAWSFSCMKLSFTLDIDKDKLAESMQNDEAIGVWQNITELVLLFDNRSEGELSDDILRNVALDADMDIKSDKLSKSESNALAPFSHNATRFSLSKWAPSPISGNWDVLESIDKPKLF